MQRDDAGLADAVESWSNLVRVLPSTIVEKEYFRKLIDMAITGVAVAAHLLHPKFRGLFVCF